MSESIKHYEGSAAQYIERLEQGFVKLVAELEYVIERYEKGTGVTPVMSRKVLNDAKEVLGR